MADSSVVSRDRHPSTSSAGLGAKVRAPRPVHLPVGVANVRIASGGHDVTLTNLGKPFWPELGVTKRDLLQYYADVAKVLLPHLRDRAMVMKRYPNGAH